MGDRDSYPPGTFCWADLGTTDAAAAKAFYARVFGWQAVDAPAGESRTYTTFKLDGRDVAALYELGAEEREQLPPHWSSYVSVENVDAAAARARELGAEVLADPLDVMDAGRMAVVRDPTGALVHLWQPGAQVGAGRVNEPGCMVWNELASPDPERAAAFFSELLGWTAEPDPTGYAVIMSDGAVNDAQPQWLVYFRAGACDETAAAVREAGGQVLAGPMDAAVGRIALVADAAGAAFALFEGQADP